MTVGKSYQFYQLCLYPRYQESRCKSLNLSQSENTKQKRKARCVFAHTARTYDFDSSVVIQGVHYSQIHVYCTYVSYYNKTETIKLKQTELLTWSLPLHARMQLPRFQVAFVDVPLYIVGELL